jgi:hypothetical protein
MSKKEEKQKEEKITFKSVLNKVMDKSMNSLVSVAAQEAEHLITWIKNLSGLGKKIRHLMTTIILFSAGLGVLGIGVALYLNEVFPNISKGTSHILVGLVIISIAALHTKYNE